MRSTSSSVRNLLKFWYARTSPPERDWITEPGYDLRDSLRAPTTDHPYGREAHRSREDAGELLYWLSGRHHEFTSDVREANLPTYLGPDWPFPEVAASGGSQA